MKRALGFLAAAALLVGFVPSARSQNVDYGISVPPISSAAVNAALGSTTSNLIYEAANTLALRNGANSQILRVYNTFTDASNYERVRIGYAANVLKITGEYAGTGIGRPLLIQADGITTVGLEDSTNNPGSASVGVYRDGTSGTTQFAVGGRGSGLTSTALLHTRLMPIINQASGTYTILDINPTETAIGAGPHFLVKGRLGAGINVFGIKNDGAIQSGDPTNGVQFKNNGGTEAAFTRADGTTAITVKAGGFRSTGGTVASLGAASGAGAGALFYVTDATATTSRSIVAGGGANKVMVWSDGTNWLIF